MRTDGRYEIKFVAQPHDLSLIGLVSRLNLAGFREVFEPREVHNFYFDTLCLSSYYENLAGTGPREKIRFRWYGDPSYPRSGMLEFKQKHGMLGWKETYPIEDIPASAERDWRIFLSHLEDSIPSRARNKLRQSEQPTLFNSYRRRYLAKSNGSVRLTIDSDIRACNQLRVARPNLDRPALVSNVVVVEIKASASAREEMTAAIQQLPLRVSRFSKYCVGLQSFLRA